MRLATVSTLLVLGGSPIAAQQPAPPIQDNSFLIEEAYNQEPGVVQHISTFARDRDGGWEYTFTQEWPLFSQRHQLSFTLPVERVQAPDATGVGDLVLNYRLQLVGNGGTRLAVSPRASVIVPTGSESEGLGTGEWGLQGNLPVSYVLTNAFVLHSNAGVTHLMGGGAPTELSLGQSVVWLLHPRLNLLVEGVWNRQLETGGGESLFVSPGLRAAFNVPGGLQIVPGVAVPLGVGASNGERQIFLYLSFEHPFTRTGG